MHFWKRLFRGNKLQVIKTTQRQSYPASLAPQLRRMLIVMVSEVDCDGQSQAIRQLEQQGAELATTHFTNPALRLSTLKAFLKVDELNRNKGGAIFKRVIYVEKDEKYRNKAAKCSPMVIAVESLDDAAKALKTLTFF